VAGVGLLVGTGRGLVLADGRLGTVTALVIDMGGVTYRADLSPAAHHAAVVVVHEALTGLGLVPYVEMPARLHEPSLGRLVTSRAGAHL
jgi:hypothetical protein